MDESHELAEHRTSMRSYETFSYICSFATEQAAEAALEAARRMPALRSPTPPAQSSSRIADKTLGADQTFALSEVADTPATSRATTQPKKKPKVKMTAKEKKERGVSHFRFLIPISG